MKFTTNQLKIFVCLFFIHIICSCGGPSPSQYAKKFCACSENLSKAEVQFKNKRIDAKTYAAIKAEQKLCMGATNPLSNFKTAKDSLAFEAAFLEALEKNCPNIARNYGFDME